MSAIYVDLARVLLCVPCIVDRFNVLKKDDASPEYLKSCYSLPLQCPRQSRLACAVYQAVEVCLTLTDETHLRLKPFLYVSPCLWVHLRDNIRPGT